MKTTEQDSKTPPGLPEFTQEQWLAVDRQLNAEKSDPRRRENKLLQMQINTYRNGEFV
jgi:hypothetical protein